MIFLPEQLDEGWYSAGLEDGEQSLSVVREVVQGAGGAARGLHIRGVDHGVDEGGDHLRGVHDGVPAGLLLGELVDHHGGPADHHLVLVVQQLGQLRDRTSSQVSIVLKQHISNLHITSWRRRVVWFLHRFQQLQSYCDEISSYCDPEQGKNSLHKILMGISVAEVHISTMRGVLAGMLMEWPIKGPRNCRIDKIAVVKLFVPKS